MLCLLSNVIYCIVKMIAKQTLPLFFIQFPPPVSSPAVPRVVAVSPQMRLVEDNPSSLSLVEIYKQRCAKKGIEHDNPISRYYDRLATVQARGTQASHQVQRQSVQPTNMLH